MATISISLFQKLTVLIAGMLSKVINNDLPEKMGINRRQMKYGKPVYNYWIIKQAIVVLPRAST